MTLRRAAVAGTWYGGDETSLGLEVAEYLETARNPPVPGRVVALVSPHAGLRYSGPVAAHAYLLLRGRRDLTVVLVGPSHRLPFEGVGVYARGAWETPLGQTPVDEDLAAALLAAGTVAFADERVHRTEHSLEMQVPFLQRVVPGLRIVPMLMGSQSRDEVEGLAEALARALRGREALLVASSDLSHYHPAAVANRMDAEVVRDVADLDPERLMTRLERAPDHACGGGPMVAVMRAAKALGATRSTVLRYADSGDVPEGDKSHVVGYLAAALTAPDRP